MGTLEAPVWMDNGGAYAAGMDRSVLWMAAPVPGIMAQDANVGSAGAEGVVAQRTLGANLSVDVSPFRAIVAESGPTNANWRNYLVKHSGTTVTNVTMPASPTGGNPRYDAVCVLVQDSTVTGSTNNWVFDVVQGTAAASPVYPTITGMRTVLAMVLRDNNQTTITTAKITNCANRLWYEGGTRLAYAKYNPGAYTQNTTITNSLAPMVPGALGTGWTAVFTAPPSGKVKVVIEAYGGWLWTAGTGTADAQGVYWAVVDSANASPSGSLYAMHHWNDTGILRREHYEARITGLTPGNVYQWWPAWRKSSVYSGTAYLASSNTNGDHWCAIYADA